MKSMFIFLSLLIAGCGHYDISYFPLGLHSKMTLEDVQKTINCKLKKENGAYINWSLYKKDSTSLPVPTLKEYSLEKDIDINDIRFTSAWFYFDSSRGYKLTEVGFNKDDDEYIFDLKDYNTSFKKKMRAGNYQFLEKKHDEKIRLEASPNYYVGFVSDAYLKDLTYITILTENKSCSLTFVLTP